MVNFLVVRRDLQLVRRGTWHGTTKFPTIMA
jgi:hypothetical protein